MSWLKAFKVVVGGALVPGLVMIGLLVPQALRLNSKTIAS
jgi:hypothetical protein